MRQLKITKSRTNRDSTSFPKYLHDVNKLAVISPDEEMVLAAAIRNGDKAALEKLVKGNLRFVISVAKQYQGLGLDITDLVSEGNIGLINAAKNFDASRGFKFITYAVWWIRQAMFSAVQHKSRLVRLPANKFKLFAAVRKTTEILEQELNYAPSAEQISASMDAPIDEINIVLSFYDKNLSLDMPTNEDDSPASETIINHNAEPVNQPLEYDASFHDDLQRALQVLTDKEKFVISCYYGINRDYSMGLEEISDQYGITKERVRQVKKIALRKLQQQKVRGLLVNYLSK